MAVSGMESMFRAMGLGQVLDMAKVMAENGTFDKILKFSDEAEALGQSVRELIAEVKMMREQNVQLDDNRKSRSLGSIEPRYIATSPGSGSADIAGDADVRELSGDVRAAE